MHRNISKHHVINPDLQTLKNEHGANVCNTMYLYTQNAGTLSTLNNWLFIKIDF